MTGIDPTTHELLISMVRDALEGMTPVERLVFFNRTTAGYCIECGESDQHLTCAFMAPDQGVEMPDERITTLVDLVERVRTLEEQRAVLCDAVQWLVNRGPDKVPGDVMEKLDQWGT